jgi:hypothetical protein
MNTNNTPIARRTRSKKTTATTISSNAISASSFAKDEPSDLVTESDLDALINNLVNQTIGGFNVHQSPDNQLPDSPIETLNNLLTDLILSDEENYVKPKKKEQFNNILHQINQATHELEENDHWWVTETNKPTKTDPNKKGLKLVSMGYAYIIDKKTEKRTYWKCERAPNCLGRGNSNGLEPPFIVTQEHNHLMEINLKDSLRYRQDIKEASTRREAPRKLIQKVETNYCDDVINLHKLSAIKDLIKRCRRKNDEYVGFHVKCLEALVIPDKFKYVNGKEFLFYDSKQSDPVRILIFTTNNNLKLMTVNTDWFCDGTFNISPTIFKQVFTIQWSIRNCFQWSMLCFQTKKRRLIKKF